MSQRKRINASQTLAKRRRLQSSIRGSLSAQIGDDIRNRINLGARQAAAEIMNRLAEKGPRYSGEFADSWRAQVIGNGGASAKNTGYPYTTRSVPTLSKALKQVRRAQVLTIANITEYAAIALDLDEPDELPYYFAAGEPAGGMEFGVLVGRRFGNIRGQVRPFTSEERARMDEDAALSSETPSRPPNISTAPLNWYTNYMRGGEVDKEIARAFGFAFAPRQNPALDYAEYVNRTRSQR